MQSSREFSGRRAGVGYSDVAIASTSASRTFVTPALQTGVEYSYNLKAEVVRDGQTYSTTQRVTVRSGAESKVTLEIPVLSVAAK